MDGLLECDGRESDDGENNVRTQFKNWGAFTNVMYDLIFQLIHLSLLFYLWKYFQALLLLDLSGNFIVYLFSLEFLSPLFKT